MIEKKRNSLEQFVREQVIGPGADRFRYVLLNHEEYRLELNNHVRIENGNELISSVPGAIYSSGVIFPVDNSGNVSSDDNSEGDLDESSFNSGLEDDESNALNQMFPNSMGISFCVLKSKFKEENPTFKVKCRHYSKIRATDVIGSCGVKIDGTREWFENHFNTISLPEIDFVQVVQVDNYNVLVCHRIPENIGEIKRALREYEKQIAREQGADENQYLSGYKIHLFNQLKNEVHDENERSEILNKLSILESCENFTSHLTDLLGIVDSRSYGIWRSKPFEIELDFPNDIFESNAPRQIFSWSGYAPFKDIVRVELRNGRWASLGLALQVTKSKNEEVAYVKIQLRNTSSPFSPEADDTRYFSAYNEQVNETSFFGMSVLVQSKNILPYNQIEDKLETEGFEDERIVDFVYRRYKDYGVGHGCSVKWNNSHDRIQLESEYLPEAETPDVDTVPRWKNQFDEKNGTWVNKPIFDDTKCMEFKWLSLLSNSSDIEVIAELKSFVTLYGKWIQSKLVSIQQLNDGDKSIAISELEKCRGDHDRMLKNVENLLEGERNIMNIKSFRLMNSAMFMQMWHSVNSKSNAVNDHMKSEDFKGFSEEFYKDLSPNIFEEGVPVAWRPFQLAFILLNLDGVLENAELDYEQRNNLVDLVWFPTGGGKTEAYLGLIGLTIINRRFKYASSAGGTAVIMRYTLRLLTLQQFQRATQLIMALELIRRWGIYSLGNEEISSGLWVGDASLPNKFRSSDQTSSESSLLSELEEINRQVREKKTSIKTKLPFTNCLWCGEELYGQGKEIRYEEKASEYRVEIKCSNNACCFSSPVRTRNRRFDHGPFPTRLCDEEIYRNPPTLLFGTVDKFAQLAHKTGPNNNERHKDSRRLFGRGNWEDGKPSEGYVTPDLIIQDELHLLMGPLGSAVGLFESVVDLLCTRTENGKIKRPKIISSTATTRNTDLQIYALFSREVNIFPKPGVECDDSFFSFYKRGADSTELVEESFISKRKYVGLYPTGKTQIWMQMRLTALILTHRAIFELENVENLEDDGYSKAADFYYSVLSYFNSLREVGKTESQIQTYILKDIRRVFNRVIRPQHMLHPKYTYTIKGGELTGRLSGEEVKSQLQSVSTRFLDSNRYARSENGVEIRPQLPPDLIVSTNMISVGIDVSRFNTIIMNSMPRNVAEYIQASSRVARNTKGIVYTVHHPFRSRDMSHYERFIEFHEKMYSYVEPISITPFTKKSIDRYFALYFATYIRQLRGFSARNSALEVSELTEDEINEIKTEVLSHFKRRLDNLENLNISARAKSVFSATSINEISAWIDRAMNHWIQIANDAIDEELQLVFNNKSNAGNQEQLYVDVNEYEENVKSSEWQVPQSLRVVEPESVINIKPR